MLFLISIISLHSDNLAHINQWIVGKMFYKHALITDSTCKISSGFSSSNLKTILDDGTTVLFLIWLNIMRSDLSSFISFIFILPLALYPISIWVPVYKL